MELTRELGVRHFLLASTSSIYGVNTEMPFVETERTDHQITLYAATKKATELMTHTYSHLWGIPTTAFRFFTVYGPVGTPRHGPAEIHRRHRSTAGRSTSTTTATWPATSPTSTT